MPSLTTSTLRNHAISLGLLLAAAPLTAHAAPPTIPLDDTQTCAACHGTIVSEWQESMHARAHSDNDPLYAAMRTLRMEKQGAEIGETCNQCHTPRSVDDPDAAAGKVGVGCATCHLAAAVDNSAPTKGAGRITWATDGVLRGSHDLPAGASPVHGTGPAAAHLTDGTTICLACHDTVSNAAGVPTCTTGTEHSADAGSCTSCHMPMVDTPAGAVTGGRAQHRSHAFLGPHRAWLQDDSSFLQSAVRFDATLANNVLTVTLGNQAGHAFPSGFPGRVAVVKAVGTDAAGAVVWSNWSTNAMKEAPESVLGKVYVDADGTPVLPPFAARLARDSRLTPGEVRAVTFKVPESVASVDVKLLFLLLPGPAADALGVAELPEAKPRVLHSRSLQR